MAAPRESPGDGSALPWLRGLDERALVDLATALSTYICRPSFGARSKREIELELFALLREHRADWTTLGEVADDLAISRSKARSLVLDYRAREVGKLGHGARREILRKAVVGWPAQQIEQKNGELKVVVDDPFIRDLLKNFAYARGILINQSFASEIQTFSWDAYALLLEALYSEDKRWSNDDFLTLTADVREQVRKGAARNTAAQVELDAQLSQLERQAEKARKSPSERRREMALTLLHNYGPKVAAAAVGALA